MLKIHLSSGQTAEVNLKDELQFRDWLARLEDPLFQESITALTVAHKGVNYSLPRPKGFRDIALTAKPIEAGKGGQRIVCFADNVRIQLVVHEELIASRISIANIGKNQPVFLIFQRTDNTIIKPAAV